MGGLLLYPLCMSLIDHVTLSIFSQKPLSMLVGVVTLCCMMLIMECHNSHQHHQSFFYWISLWLSMFCYIFLNISQVFFTIPFSLLLSHCSLHPVACPTVYFSLYILHLSLSPSLPIPLLSLSSFSILSSPFRITSYIRLPLYIWIFIPLYSSIVQYIYIHIVTNIIVVYSCYYNI